MRSTKWLRIIIAKPLNNFRNLTPFKTSKPRTALTFHMAIHHIRYRLAGPQSPHPHEILPKRVSSPREIPYGFGRGQKNRETVVQLEGGAPKKRVEIQVEWRRERERRIECLMQISQAIRVQNGVGRKQKQKRAKKRELVLRMGAATRYVRKGQTPSEREVITKWPLWERTPISVANWSKPHLKLQQNYYKQWGTFECVTMVFFAFLAYFV